MMNDELQMTKDKELITKERATNTVKHLFGQGCLAVCKAIDALEPIAEARSEEEIRGAIERLDKTLVEKFTFEPKYGDSPQSNLPTIWHQNKHMYEYLREGLRAVLKETNLWDFLFSAPDPADKEGGTGETSKS